jgi:glyoxalase-like protein
MPAAPPGIDHLVYGTRNLDAAVEELEGRLGVRASPGGRHPGKGTRNALLALGPSTYLEILGPDWEQPDPDSGRWMGVEHLEEPRLVRWCAVHPDLDRLLRQAERAGLDLGKVQSGQRSQADGVSLSWRLTDPMAVPGHGTIPFFIDWGTSPHPAQSAAPGMTLLHLEVTHPRPAFIRGLFDSLDLDLPVHQSPHAAIIATLQTPNGTVELR